MDITAGDDKRQITVVLAGSLIATRQMKKRWMIVCVEKILVAHTANKRKAKNSHKTTCTCNLCL